MSQGKRQYFLGKTSKTAAHLTLYSVLKRCRLRCFGAHGRLATLIASIVAGVWAGVGFSIWNNCPDPDPDSKILEQQEQSWSLKKWLRQPLVQKKLKIHRIQIQIHSSSLLCIRGGTGSGKPESTPAEFCVFVSDPDPDPGQKFEKNGPGPESLFNFGSSRSLCGHFSSKNMGKLRLDRWL